MSTCFNNNDDNLYISALWMKGNLYRQVSADKTLVFESSFTKYYTYMNMHQYYRVYVSKAKGNVYCISSHFTGLKYQKIILIGLKETYEECSREQVPT